MHFKHIIARMCTTFAIWLLVRGGMGGGLIAVEGLSLATAQPFLFPLCLETQEYFYFPIFSSFVATSDGRRPPPPNPTRSHYIWRLC